MRKTLQKKRKIRSKKTKTKKRYKGGSYYAYNQNPMRFTRSTTLRGGSPFTLNTSDTLIPQGLVNMGRSFMYNSSNNTFNGSYPPVNPDPVSQPISKSYMLGK
jgi:hypothetical protein